MTVAMMSILTFTLCFTLFLFIYSSLSIYHLLLRPSLYPYYRTVHHRHYYSISWLRISHLGDSLEIITSSRHLPGSGSTGYARGQRGELLSTCQVWVRGSGSVS